MSTARSPNIAWDRLNNLYEVIQDL